MLPPLVEVQAKHVLSPTYDIAGSEEAVEASNMFVREIADLLSSRRVESWTLWTGLVPVQAFLLHIIHLLENMYKDATLFEKCQHIPLSRWSDKQPDRFYSMDAGTFPALHTSAHGIPVRKSATSHADAGLGYFLSDSWKKAI